MTTLVTLPPQPAALAAPFGNPPAPDMAAAFAPIGILLAVLAVVTLAVLLLAADRRRWSAPPHPTRRRRAPLSTWGMRLATLGSLLALGLGAGPARGQVDHLQCFKASDATLRHLRGAVDLDAPSIGVAPGCKLSKAKLYCVPARQQVEPGTLFDGGKTLTELPYHGPPAETDRICYRVKCTRPVGSAADQVATDRFGPHTLRGLETSMVCTPAVGGTLPPPAEGFQVSTPPIEIQPGQDVTYCYYFRTPNVPLAVTRLVSALGPAGRGLVFFTTTENGQPAERLPAGTVSAANCDILPNVDETNWRYAGYGPSDELALPTDDGNGHPLAMEIPALSAGVLMIHFKNETATAVTSGATLNAEALGDPVYTPTATLLSYEAPIGIPPLSSGHVEAAACDVPAGVRFWNLSTFAHKQAVRTNVVDGFDVVLESLDWTRPDSWTTSTPPFFSFASGKLGHGCEYDNPSTRTITAGPSQQSDEECIGVGYFFPGTQPRFCYGGFVIP